MRGRARTAPEPASDGRAEDAAEHDAAHRVRWRGAAGRLILVHCHVGRVHVARVHVARVHVARVHVPAAGPGRAGARAVVAAGRALGAADGPPRRRGGRAKSEAKRS
ncbi:hypothetical protein GCM10022416_34670 [Actinomadura keratinilytica]|uniref:Uncharacterized protein n=1 Tax=Actinomadura keratinilytica TaxID=547461 RepID=A0ABP7Z2J6_9ACTN